MEGNLWTREPLLALSESQVLGEFRTFLLQRPEGDQQGPLLQCERDNLRRMGIKVHKESEEIAGAWTWSRDPHFPQQSNLLDCGMVAVVTVIHLSRGWRIPSMHATSIAGYRQWLVQVITNDCEKVFEVPCHRCGTNQLHSQMKKVECGDKQRCDEARESLLDDASCVSHGGNSSTALRRKRPTEAIQTQTQKPPGDNGNRASGKPKPLACQTKVADATDMDIDVVSDQAQHPTAKTESIGLGAEADPGEVIASGGETMVRANKQRNPIDAYKANRTPRQMESHKWQKLLTECWQAITISRPSVTRPTSTDNEKQGKPTPRNKRVQSGESGSAWVCNLLGAKQVSSCPVSAREITADRCAKCANPLVGSQ
jgi:hypothetical protein